MIGGSGGKRKLREIGRSFLAELLTPLIEIIERKRKWMLVRVEMLDEHRELLREYQRSPSYELMTRLEQLEQELREARPLAFSAVSPAEQNRFMAASQYDDMWSETVDSQTGLKNKLCAWYLCENNTSQWSSSPVCATLTLSKVWLRKNPSGATAVKNQRWYCPSCSGRYRHAYGMMVQVIIAAGTKAQTDWCMLADCADKDIDDLKAMFHESTLQPKTPEELFKLIPDRLPSLSSGTLRPARLDECQYAKDWAGEEGRGADRPLNYGIYKVTNLPELKKLAKFDWNQIFTFVK